MDPVLAAADQQPRDEEHLGAGNEFSLGFRACNIAAQFLRSSSREYFRMREAAIRYRRRAKCQQVLHPVSRPDVSGRPSTLS